MKKAYNWIFLLIILLPCLGLGPLAQAASRTALVVGIADYPGPGLAPAVRQALAMEEALTNLGFQVTSLLNPNLAGLMQNLQDWSRKLPGASVSLLYFAGRGFSAQGRQFLVPARLSPPPKNGPLEPYLDLEVVASLLGAGGCPVNLVVLQAWAGPSPALAPGRLPADTLLLWATPPLAAAPQASWAGVFTNELIKALQTPGLKLEEISKRVRAATQGATGGLVNTGEASTLTHDYYLLPQAATAAPPGQAQAQASAASPVAPAPAPRPAGPNGVMNQMRAQVLFDQANSFLFAIRGAPRYSEAQARFTQAADLGHAPSQNNLGVMLAQGQAGPKDMARARSWWERASQGGNCVASFNLALMYALGDGVDVDLAQRNAWTAKARDQGFLFAGRAEMDSVGDYSPIYVFDTGGTNSTVLDAGGL